MNALNVAMNFLIQIISKMIQFWQSVVFANGVTLYSFIVVGILIGGVVFLFYRKNGG